MKTANLKIDGMTCGHCVASVRKALETVDGATVDSVDIGSAKVSFDPRDTSADALVLAVVDAGYPATASMDQ